MNILLSGISGFIGQQLLRQSEGWIIFHCIVRDNKSGDDDFYVERIDGDTVWKGAFDSIDTIIHLASIAHNKSRDKHEMFNVNTCGTIKLAREARRAGVKRFVFVSTGAIGNETTINHEKASFQTQSKYNAELGLKQIAEETGLEVVIVRPTLVYGPDAPGNFGLAKNRCYFIAVQNLADLLVTYAKHPNAAGHTLNGINKILHQCDC